MLILKSINSLDKTLEDIARTLDSIKHFNTSYNKFKDDFTNLFSKLGEQLAGALPNSNLSSIPGKPSNVEEAALILASCDKVLWLTGAGISVESNIPTFRGDNGFWTVRGILKYE